MSLCAACALEIAAEICPHHLTVDPGWADGNRILCDLLHRGMVPERLPVEEREPLGSEM